MQKTTSLPQTIDCHSPVTIIIKRRPKAGFEKQFEQIMAGTTRDAMAFPGHLGVNILRPTSAGDFYRIIFKFDSMRHYIAWESSEIRQKWIERYAEVTIGDDEQEILSGLETWFTLPGAESLVPPPRYKMAMIVWISIFPLSLLIHHFVNKILGIINPNLHIFISSIILVLLMTYLVMPFMSKTFEKWLHCQKK